MHAASLVVGTAGHIDHGKSALVRALTGTDPDRLKEEQARGITIDLGFAHLSAGDVQLAFVDVPGHERFVRNMLAGAGGIDAVLLVVAANESVMPQTREHFDICRLLGVSRGVVALTKADLVDEETLALATLDVRELIQGSFLEAAPILPVSAKTGAGLDLLVRALASLAGGVPRQARTGVVRLPVDRVFSVKGFGAVVTGTLVSGAVAAGDELAVLPQGQRARVRGVQVHGESVDVARAPGRVALNLAGADAGALARGVTLATPGAFAVTRRVDAHLTLLAGARPLPHGARVRVHHGTAEVFGRVSVAAMRSGPATEWVPALPGASSVVVPPGGEAFVRLRLEGEAVLTRGDRLVLRAYSPARTIAGALVLDPEVPSAGTRRPGQLERFRLLLDGNPAVRWLTDAGGLGLGVDDLVRRGGQSPDEAETMLSGLRRGGQAVDAGGRAFAIELVEAMGNHIRQVLGEFHRARPTEAGIPTGALRDLVARGAAGEVFNRVVEDLIARQVLRGGERVALATHRLEVSAAGQAARERLAGALRSAGLSPPDLATLASVAGLLPADVEGAVHAMVKEGALVRLGTLIFHPEPLDRLRRAVKALREGQPAQARITVDVGTFKERFNVTRKFAIPLLEWLDRERVTRRVGDVRVVL